ncbi:MAG: transglutaminase domain-containing protein [Candidatus Omnitrophica bacterium]|nr:transglutaminase domain-containing protein [Candidatus Omnitrophota bacterium]
MKKKPILSKRSKNFFKQRTLVKGALYALGIGGGVLLIAAVVFALFLNEKSYNGIMMDVIAHRLTAGSPRAEDAVTALREYVHDNVSPVTGELSRSDTVGIEKLTSGVGWCDQKSRVFMSLARPLGITTRLLFLLNEQGRSPHSIAEADLGGRWVLVDPSYNLDLVDANGAPATRDDIIRDPAILRDNSMVRTFSLYAPEWGTDEYLSMYTRTPNYVNTRKGSRSVMTSFVPPAIARTIACYAQDIYIPKAKKDYPDLASYRLFTARSYHLSGRMHKAEVIYREVLTRPDMSYVHDRARFFLALLLREEGRYDEAARVLTSLITRPVDRHWVPFARGLRSSLYKKLGEDDKAMADFSLMAEYPDAYFK